MTRAIIVWSVALTTATAAPCQPHVSRSEAIRIAKQQIAQHWGSERLHYFGPFSVELHDCSWTIRVVSPVRDAPRQLFIAVDASTGSVQYDVQQNVSNNTRNVHEQQR